MTKYKCANCQRVYDMSDAEFTTLLLNSKKTKTLCCCGSLRLDRVEE